MFANDSLFWPICWLIKSESQGGPWIVTHIGQGGMVDDWWQSAPGKIATPPSFTWESGGGVAIFPVYAIVIITL